MEKSREKSKLFNTMGRSIGLTQVKKTHRGYIAKKVLPKVEAWETAKFEEACPQIKFRTILINDPLNGRSYYV